MSALCLNIAFYEEKRVLVKYQLRCAFSLR